MYFPVAGIQLSPLIPFVAACVISFFTSMGGISGAFLLLPFQVSILGFTGPAVTPTNHFFNVVAIPSGVFRYFKEGRMIWPLTITILLGTLPGVVLGSFIRLRYLVQPRRFKLFISCVLLAISSRIIKTIILKKNSDEQPTAGDPLKQLRVSEISFDSRRIEYRFAGKVYRISILSLLLLTSIVGIIGGAYGVGGGAIIAPFLVSFFHLPVHTIAGATLSGSGFTSLLGVIIYCFAESILGVKGGSPDWMLGGLFGLGGLVGMFLGAGLQKRFSSRFIESLLAFAVFLMGLSYLIEFFSKT